MRAFFGLALGGVLVAPPALAASATYAMGSVAPDVRFTVDAPLDAIVGVTASARGSVVFDPDTLTIGPARISVDAASFQTGISLRDEDLRDQFFEAPRFPSITLKLQKLVASGALKPGGHVQAQATGTLELHGVTREIAFPAGLERTADGNGVTVVASFPVALADYSIARPRRLFLKLGDVARVEVRATFVSAAPPPSTGAAPATAGATPEPPDVPRARPPAPLPARVVSRKSLPRSLLATARKPPEPHFAFRYNTAEGRGERLLIDASIGGAGNALTCVACHSTVDERPGLTENGIIHASHTLFDAAHRQTLWQGFAKTPGKAASLCAKMFMLKPDGLDDGKQADLQAYLEKISPDDVVPDLDYRAFILTKKTGLANPTAGNARSGSKLVQRYCEGCHGVGEMRPPLTPGLYEADYLVQRARHLPGTDARQMPPMYLDRLRDSELRDIVTYLSDESQRVFKRNRPPPPKPAETKPVSASAAAVAPSSGT